MDVAHHPDGALGSLCALRTVMVVMAVTGSSLPSCGHGKTSVTLNSQG